MWKLKASERMKIIGASFKGRARPEGAGSPSIQIEVLDLETQIKTIYPSRAEASKALGLSPRSVGRYFSGEISRPYKGRYMIKIFNSEESGIPP